MYSSLRNLSDTYTDTASTLYESMSLSILNPTIDLGIDYAEIAIDQIMQDGLLRDLPIVKSFVQAGKAAVAIRDLFCLKKTIRFIIEMNNGDITSEKLEKHRISLENHPEKLKREMESVLICLDRENEAVKASILARFYKLYIDETISFDWQDFKIFSEILESFSVYDLKTLEMIYRQRIIKSEQKINMLSLSRLSSLGLVEYYGGISAKVDGVPNIIAKISEVGKFFTDMVLKFIREEWRQWAF